MNSSNNNNKNNANGKKILHLSTAFTHIIKLLISIFSEILTEANFVVMKGNNPESKLSESDLESEDENIKKKSSKKKKSNQESDIEVNTKAKKKSTQKTKKVSSSEESSDVSSDSEEEEDNKKSKKNKNTKKNKKSKVSSSESSESSESSDNDDSSDKKKQKKNSMDHNEDGETGGIKMFNIDKNRTVLIYFRLFPSAFTKFYCKNKQQQMGLDLGVLNKALKPFSKDNVITFSIGDTPELYISSKRNVGGTQKAFVKMMEVDTPLVQHKNPEFDVIVTISSKEFHFICKSMTDISDYVQITCTRNKISFACCSEVSGMMYEYENKKDVDIKINDKSSVKPEDIFIKNIYDLKSISRFTKCSTISVDVRILLKRDFPLFIKYIIPHGHFFVGHVPIVDVRLDDKEKDDGLYEDSKLDLKDNI